MKTRMILCKCPSCGMKIRTTRAWIERSGVPICQCRRVTFESEWTPPTDPWEEDAAELEKLEWTLIRDDRVTTRVPHVCDGCKVEYPRDEPMRYRVFSVEGEFFSVYTCFDCDSQASTRGGRSATARA